MDYLKLLRGLKKDFLESGKAKYKSVNGLVAFICTLFFIPARICFFFARLAFWFTWLFFRGFAAPVEYLDKWLEKSKEGLGDVSKAALVLVAVPVTLAQHTILAFASLAFFMQWFMLDLTAFIMTLGATKWQPVVTDATYED